MYHHKSKFKYSKCHIDFKEMLLFNSCPMMGCSNDHPLKATQLQIGCDVSSISNSEHQHPPQSLQTAAVKREPIAR